MGGMNCGNGGHSSPFGGRMFVCAFLGSILGAFKVYHRQNHKILIIVFSVHFVDRFLRDLFVEIGIFCTAVSCSGVQFLAGVN